MERYLVDTTVLIDLSRGMSGIRGRLDRLIDSGAELGVCAINVAEFVSGVPNNQLFRWDRLLSEFLYWDISHEAAVLAGAYRQALARQGKTLKLPDAIVAAVATTLGATILTDNVNDFLQIADVRVRTPRY